MSLLRLIMWMGILLGCFFQGSAQKSKLQHEVTRFTQQEKFRHASISIAISDLKTGELVARFDPDRSLIPASSMKLLSSYYAYRHLGSEYRFKTGFILRYSAIQDGVVYGDLVVEPGGDPSFGSVKLADNVKLESITDSVSYALRKLGVHKIQGRIIIEEDKTHIFRDNPEWLYYDLANYYGAPYRTFNFLENSAGVELAVPDGPGALCTVVQVSPECATGVFRSQMYTVDRPPYTVPFLIGSHLDREFTVLGRIQAGKENKIKLGAALPDPGATFSCVFAELLQKQGIEIGNVLLNSQELVQDEKIWNHASQPLTVLIQRCLGQSVNLYAEAFLLHTGRMKWSEADLDWSLEEMIKFYAGMCPECSGIKIFDGSGMSPKNRMSAGAMNRILMAMVAGAKFQEWLDLIPNPSETGPLSGLIAQRGKVQFRMKSGSMESVRAYAGYVLEDGKAKYAISLLINQYDAGAVEIKKSLAEFFQNLSKHL